MPFKQPIDFVLRPHAVSFDVPFKPIVHDGAERLALGSNAGRPARTRCCAGRARSRAVSMDIPSVGPSVVHICLPSGARATVAKDLAPVGVTRT